MTRRAKVVNTSRAISPQPIWKGRRGGGVVLENPNACSPSDVLSDSIRIPKTKHNMGKRER